MLPFSCLHGPFYSFPFEIFLHHLLDFIPLDFLLSIAPAEGDGRQQKKPLPLQKQGQELLASCGTTQIGFFKSPLFSRTSIRALRITTRAAVSHYWAPKGAVRSALIGPFNSAPASAFSPAGGSLWAFATAYSSYSLVCAM